MGVNLPQLTEYSVFNVNLHGLAGMRYILLNKGLMLTQSSPTMVAQRHKQRHRADMSRKGLMTSAQLERFSSFGRVLGVLVDFRLSWGTNETLCTSSLNSWWRLPRVEEPTPCLLRCRESRFRKVAATKYLVRRYSQSYWFPKIT